VETREEGAVARSRSHRGQALIIAILALVVLTIAAVSLSTTARLEVRAARRGVDEVQREAALRGAVNRGLALLEQGRSDPETLLSTLRQHSELDWKPFAVEPDGGPPRLEVALQLQDASAQIDLNTADSSQLGKIPGMSEKAAGSMASWRDEESKDNYRKGARPYDVKRRPFDTVEELLLVHDVEASAFFGAPTVRETKGLSAPPVSEWLTTLSGENNTDAEGNPRVNVNDGSIQNLLEAANRTGPWVDAQQVENLVAKLHQRQGPSNAPQFRTVSEALREADIPDRSWGAVLDAWTADARTFLPGRVNVNTASPAVLASISGMTRQIAQKLVERREETPEGLTWADLVRLMPNAERKQGGEEQPPQQQQQQQQQNQQSGPGLDQFERLLCMRSAVYRVRCLVREPGSTRVDAVSALVYWPADGGDAKIVQWRRPDRYPGWTAWYRPLREDEESLRER
jgi:DNA uptake protein ComE-like DNA-binding protein